MVGALLAEMMTPVLMLVALLNCQFLDSYALPIAQKYAVIIPQRLYSLHTQDKYPDVVQYELQLDGKTLVIHLEKTKDLIPHNYTETRYLPDDTPVMTSSGDQIQDHCHYQGYVKDDVDSVAIISTCTGISIALREMKGDETQGRSLLIEPLDLADIGEHAVYEEEEETARTCGVIGTDWEEASTQKMSRPNTAAKKMEIDMWKSQKYIELYVVADNSMFEKYGRNATIIRNRIFGMVNYVNKVYKSINTIVALIGIEIWDNKNQVEVNGSAPGNLDRFSAWGKESILPRVTNDNAQLITNKDFDGPTVGLAFTSSMCTSLSAGVIQDHSKNEVMVGVTLAHEMGHNLGLSHDDVNCSCSAGPCVMLPVLSARLPNRSSNCSQNQFKKFLLKNVPNCMINKPNREKDLATAVCGNMFTELGEDCDCGTVQECTNPCCDAATCKMKKGAVCAEGDCCENCKYMKAGAVCRPSSNDCDLPDMCDGNSNLCTTDRIKDNGVSCMDGQGYSKNGMCPTHKTQCTADWGPGSVVANNSCYNINTVGRNYGYCKQWKETYKECNQP
ncbi:zinc metalloproteinase-disintegrin-like protein H3 [Mixophyes fleayi]|uniref:zinc metalloproteinase-disintegrin-like protein H3 n=1 Tax=Mixophyes fleayi TaxID=3061075 RepID=UPI003F4D800B